jgi:hypothetical protein
MVSVYRLIALARSRGEGNSAATMATIADTAPAPPKPCTKRAITSSPWERASPQAAEASVTIVPSMMLISWPRQTTARAIQRALGEGEGLISVEDPHCIDDDLL